jgi:hypothetical protein
MYIIQKVPIGETANISASTMRGSGRGGIVSVLVTSQNANPATTMPRKTHKRIFILVPSGMIQLIKALKI